MSRILFVGPLWQGSTSCQRLQSLRELGYQVEAVDTSPVGKSPLQLYGARLGRRLGFDRDLAQANPRIEDAVSLDPPGLIWIEKGLTINPSLLIRIKQRHPEIVLVSYSPDDMLCPANQSRSYRGAIKLYDWHVTNKSFNVETLASLGAQRVHYATKSFDERAYFPHPLQDGELKLWGADVAFLGGYERQRFESMLALAQAGIRVRIWGPGWEPKVDCHPHLDVRPGWVQAEDAAKVFSATRINLHFLRKIVGDQHTDRSVEIPACKAFMLAERTQEHLDLFEEGREAEYFDDNEELATKVKTYLGDDDRRQAIAAAGYQRCWSSGYANSQRLREILDVVWGAP